MTNVITVVLYGILLGPLAVFSEIVLQTNKPARSAIYQLSCKHTKSYSKVHGLLIYCILTTKDTIKKIKWHNCSAYSLYLESKRCLAY